MKDLGVGREIDDGCATIDCCGMLIGKNLSMVMIGKGVRSYTFHFIYTTVDRHHQNGEGRWNFLL